MCDVGALTRLLAGNARKGRELRNKPFYHQAEDVAGANVYVGLTITSAGL